MASISISVDFLSALAKLPKEVQKKAREFMEKFQSNPRAPGINYESIAQARDRRFRSVRIDQNYRAIVLSPDRGDHFLMLWVDSHDDAYDWAKRRTAEIHPVTGALQILVAPEMIEETEQPTSMPEPASAKVLFDLTEDQLMKLGIPQQYVPLIGIVRSADDLAKVGPFLPQECYEALQFLADGEPFDEVVAAYSIPAKVDVGDLDVALENADTKRRFVTVTDSAELEAMLDAPMATWRIFLHPSQRKLVERSANGPIKVVGGPGTGKTVVALHRACHLAQLASGTGRVLLTTFSKSLAVDLKEMCLALSGPIENLEIIHLHSWLHEYLTSTGMKVIPMEDSRALEIWEECLSLSNSSLTQTEAHREWREVILDQNIRSEEGYLAASRRGVKGRMDRSARIAFWPVIERFRERCEQSKQRDWAWLARMAVDSIESRGDFKPFAHVLVDEAQDFSPIEWRLIRCLVVPGANDIYLTGDAHQRIYGHKIVLSRYGIDTRGRSTTLKLNYRTTREIRNWARALFEGHPVDDLEDEAASLRGYASLLSGPPPTIHSFASEEAEGRGLVEILSHALEQYAPDAICLCARSRALIERRILGPLRSSNIPFGVLDGERRPRESEVTVATMHRIKGTEFRMVIIVAVEEGEMPPRFVDVNYPAALERERALLFMAATRCRDELVITHVGMPSAFL